MSGETPVYNLAFHPTPRVSISEFEPTLTKQEFKKQCDVNAIIKRAEGTGLITHINPIQGTYGDFVDSLSYDEALNRVLAAQQAFAALDADLRKRFGNDPGNFIDFVSNPDNADELVELGLADPPPEPPAPVQVEVVNSPETPAPGG